MRSLLRPNSRTPLRMSAPTPTSRRRARIAAWAASGLMALSAPLLSATQATADDRYFQVGYGVSVNGLTVGKGAFTGRVVENGYRLKGETSVAGIAGLLFNYTATGEVEGRIATRAPQPRVFGSKASESRASQRVAMTFSRNEVANIAIQPQPRPESELGRVQLTRNHLSGVIDPMSAMIVPAGRKGLHPSACNRTIPVFNGRERFDIVLSHKGFKSVPASGENSFNGDVIVCQARYKPIAGHRQNGRDVAYFAKAQDIELWLAPAGNTGLLLPYRISVPTPLGRGIVQANVFVASQDGNLRRAALD
jgi:hypothetical protein